MSDQKVEGNTTRATARLPGLDIEIIHRRSFNDEAEQISINLQAMPSFEAFGRYLGDGQPICTLGSGCPNGVVPLALPRVFATLPSPNITSMLPSSGSTAA